MILRIVLGQLLAGRDAHALADLRAQLTSHARTVRGLESLVVGARRMADTTPSDAPVEGAMASVWRDAESMLAATAVDEQGRFLDGRLALPFEVDHADHYELVDRTFAALPPESLALLRILRVPARRNDEARLVEILRSQQPRLVRSGLVASHLGRRLTRDGVEVVTVGIWPDREAVAAATSGRPDLPAFPDELTEWLDEATLESLDGIEVTPRLPATSGPPLLVLDEGSFIVDITATAAAMLGLPPDELVGRRADTFDLVADGIGEARWEVPEVGSVLVRYLARRDVPIAGRHTVVVRRWHDPPPTPDELDVALREAFHIG